MWTPWCLRSSGRRRVQEAKDRLSVQRDRSAMQLSPGAAIPGDYVSIGSGAAAMVLSLLSTRLQRSGKTRIRAGYRAGQCPHLQRGGFAEE